MRILWAPNPLATRIELDEVDREKLRLKLYIESLEDRLYSAYFSFLPPFRATRSRQSGEPDTLEAAVETALYYLKPPTDKGYEEGDDSADYVSALLGQHDGDCVCQACSCLKCRAESFLGVDTIKGLGKHEAAKIGGLFLDGIGIDQIIAKLADYEPIRTKAWEKYPAEDFQRHVPRWREEGKRAHAWLVQYKQEKLDFG